MYYKKINKERKKEWKKKGKEKKVNTRKISVSDRKKNTSYCY